MIAIDLVNAYGHYNVIAKHRSTIELTKDNFLTPRGDCIIGIKSDKGANSLSIDLKRIISTDNSYIYVILKVENLENVEVIRGRGSRKLTLENPNKIIIRKSNYISDATIMINSNKAAIDINRDIINELRNGSKLFAYIIASYLPLEDKEILRILINFDPITFSKISNII
jgi:hypothetical protein